MEKKNLKRFHENEIAFCGYSGSGKTTLISRLTKLMGDQLNIGYVKHDAHQFQMDKEGKDTWSLQKSGAKTVFINDSNHWAVISKMPINQENNIKLFKDMDLVFVEGYKNSLIPKFILIDPENAILDNIKNREFENIIGFIGIDDDLSNFDSELPYFQRDDIDGIKKHLIENIRNKCVNNGN